MPWCDPCERYLSPNTVATDGRCPECGRAVEAGHARAASPPAKVPWHFWLLLTATGAYLGWRAAQGIMLVL